LRVEAEDKAVVGEEGLDEEEGTRLLEGVGMAGEGDMCVWNEEEVARIGRWSNEEDVGEDMAGGSLFWEEKV